MGDKISGLWSDSAPDTATTNTTNGINQATFGARVEESIVALWKLHVGEPTEPPAKDKEPRKIQIDTEGLVRQALRDEIEDLQAYITNMAESQKQELYEWMHDKLGLRIYK